MKIVLLLCLLLILYGLSPLQMSSVWNTPEEDALIITGQACGCPCPQSRIIEGKLDVPLGLQATYPEMYKEQLNLTGNSPFDPFIYEIATAELLIQGKVIGVDTIRCTPGNCEVAPLLEVEEWELKSYIPRYLLWNSALISAYEYFLKASVILLLVFIVNAAFPQFLKKL